MAIRPGTKYRPKAGTDVGVRARSPDAKAQARPTLYNGIQMRSRLEADFAQHYLDVHFPGRWEYEPDCFACEAGQYLPDFYIASLDIYIEVKPEGFGPIRVKGLKTHADEIDAALQKMEIIWASKPTATLILVLWKYREGPGQAFSALGTHHIWMWAQEAGKPWSVWPGRGQYEMLALHLRRCSPLDKSGDG